MKLQELKEKVKEIIKDVIETVTNIQRNSAAGIFVLLLAFALIRLIFMQACTHSEYEKLAGNVSLSETDIGEIQDRNGKLVARKAAVKDLKILYPLEDSVSISTGIYNKNDSREYPKCSDKNFGISKKWWKLQYDYTHSCSVFRNQNAYRNKVFQNYFMEQNPSLQSVCKKSTNTNNLICRDIDFADYLEYQQQLQYIYDIRYISGFKFRQASNNNLLLGICINKDNEPFRSDKDFQEKIKIIKIKQLKKAKSENKDKDKKIYEYCSSIEPRDYVSLEIVPKEIFEKNALTHYSLSDIAKNYTADNPALKEGIEAGEYDTRVNRRHYCKGEYNDKLCKAMYKRNIDLIKSFFTKNRKYFENVNDIIRQITNADPKSSDPVKLTEISVEDYYRLLPEVHVSADGSGTYWTDGLGFTSTDVLINMLGSYTVPKSPEINASDADIVSLDKNRKLKLPLRSSTEPADYMLSTILGLNQYGRNIIEVIASTDTKSLVKTLENEHWRGIAPKYASELKKGEKIQLTIDAEIQAIAEMEIRKRCEEMKADRGFAIIQNVNNGDIIAMAEYSSPYSKMLYENKKEREYGKYEQWNPGYPANIPYRIYKPGSTFKPFVIAFALENGVIKENEPIELLKKYMTLKNSKDSDISKAWEEIREHGRKDKMPAQKLTPQEIIAKSSNIGTAYIAYKMWEAKGSKYPADSYAWENDFDIIRHAKDFGFGVKTGIEDEISVLESAGYVIPENAYDPDKPGGKRLILTEYLKTSYGQGPMYVTPLQLITAYSALVNGGTLYKPRIIKKIGDKEILSPKGQEGLISSETSAVIRKYMKAVMECNKGICGTGSRYKPKGVEIGAKSGTAVISMGTGKKTNQANLASFIGFVPYEKPEYTILVMIDENDIMAGRSPRYRLEGADAAGPVVKKLSEYINEKMLKNQDQTGTIQEENL